MWNKSERDGKASQVKGRVKQALGDLSGNTAMKAEGQRDEAAGKAEEAVGAISRKAGAAIEKLGAAVKK